ncbi:amphoterin-induced protein 3 [Elgaria multicarinata webbii]|uniref:amphoterin-induced protein 3 n=1 Tax=Elgaria multicarinata webbii TaxID=159646 RepID=UPI002FCD5278
MEHKVSSSHLGIGAPHSAFSLASGDQLPQNEVRERKSPDDLAHNEKVGINRKMEQENYNEYWTILLWQLGSMLLAIQGELHHYMMNVLTLATFIWKLLGQLLVFFELCVQGSTLNHFSTLMRCPEVCICTADLLSCAKKNLQQVPVTLPPTATTLDLSHNAIVQLDDHWLTALPRLQTLQISHNQISNITRQAFYNASSLVHLDISSNWLHTVEEYYFEGLVNLKELLLYNNKIVQVDENAFVQLTSLRKVYLSWNRLTKFPFESIQRLEYPYLRTLDLSANNLSSIPVQVVSALPVYIRNGLYLHNNPVRCDCSLHLMLQDWKHRGFSSVQDFKEEHICKAYANVPLSLINTFKYTKYFGDCSWSQNNLGIQKMRCLVGESLIMDCNTSLHDDSTTTYRWVSPRHELFRYPEHSDKTHQPFENGSLKITNTNLSHSGVYVCIAISALQNISQTHEVNVTVQYPKLVEPFNTALTTLLGCVVSLVLVLMYLYLTPCRCSKCCKKPASPPQDCSAQSSILSTTPPATDGPNRKSSANRHVVFLEPIKEAQNGKVKLAVSEDFPDAKKPKLLQLKLDTESISSVFSDPPIISYEARVQSPADA